MQKFSFLLLTMTLTTTDKYFDSLALATLQVVFTQSGMCRKLGDHRLGYT